MRRKARLTVAVVLMLGALGYLITTGVSESAAYYVTVDELKGRSAQLAGKPARVSGTIDERSIEWDRDKLLLRFDIKGETGERLRVEYNGMKPDNMKDGWEAIVEGRLTPGGTFKASQVLIKCPSRYESQTPPDGYDPSKHTPVNPGSPSGARGGEGT